MAISGTAGSCTSQASMPLALTTRSMVVAEAGATDIAAARNGIAIATAARWTGFDKTRAIAFTNASPRA